MNELDDLRRQLEAANARAEAAERVNTPDDSLQVAIAEFERSYVADVPSLMNTAMCHHEENGRVCGLRYKDTQNNLTHLSMSHTFLPQPRKEATRHESYTLTSVERARLEQRDPTVAETHMSIAQAAKALGQKPADVREMVRSGGLQTDKVGSVVLVRRQSVEKLLALAELSEDEPDPLPEVTDEEIVAGLERAMESAGARV